MFIGCFAFVQAADYQPSHGAAIFLGWPTAGSPRSALHAGSARWLAALALSLCVSLRTEGKSPAYA
jgi:hypothetical protein